MAEFWEKPTGVRFPPFNGYLVEPGEFDELTKTKMIKKGLIQDETEEVKEEVGTPEPTEKPTEIVKQDEPKPEPVVKEELFNLGEPISKSVLIRKEDVISVFNEDNARSRELKREAIENMSWNVERKDIDPVALKDLEGDLSKITLTDEQIAMIHRKIQDEVEIDMEDILINRSKPDCWRIKRAVRDYYERNILDLLKGGSTTSNVFELEEPVTLG